MDANRPKRGRYSPDIYTGDGGYSQKRLVNYSPLPSQELMTPRDFINSGSQPLCRPSLLTPPSVGLRFSNHGLQSDRDPLFGIGLREPQHEYEPAKPLPQLLRGEHEDSHSRTGLSLSLNTSISLPEYQLNDSFDFADLASIDLSQPNPELNTRIPLENQTPPPSVEPPQEPYFADNQNGIVHFLKFEGQNPQYETICLGDSTQEESSQDESQGTRIPNLESFPGKFNFEVNPVEKANRAICCYDEDRNKVLCQPRRPISFEIKLDFDIKKYKELSVEAVLYYTSNALIMKKPIMQCVTCSAEDRRALPVPIRIDTDRVIRSDNPHAVYFMKKGFHHGVKTPLEKLQNGATSIKRNYSFNCLNSCHKKMGPESRSWTLMFYLMDRNVEVGRHCYNLKVSKCPGRDLSNERKKIPKQIVKKSSESIKVESPATTNQTEAAVTVPTPPKRPRLSHALHVEDNVVRQPVDMNPRPGPSRLLYQQEAVVHPPPAPGVVTLAESDVESVSVTQSESQRYNCTLARKINHYLRLALAYKNHPTAGYRELARSWLAIILGLERQMDFNVNSIFIGPDGNPIGYEEGIQFKWWQPPDNQD